MSAWVLLGANWKRKMPLRRVGDLIIESKELTRQVRDCVIWRIGQKRIEGDPLIPWTVEKSDAVHKRSVHASWSLSRLPFWILVVIKRDSAVLNPLFLGFTILFKPLQTTVKLWKRLFFLFTFSHTCSLVINVVSNSNCLVSREINLGLQACVEKLN